MATDDPLRQLSVDELENANLDRSVNVPVMVRGMMTRTSAGNWVFLGSDANYLRVSAVGVTTTSAPLSADSSSISAIQGDAGLLRVSALGTFSTTPQNDSVSTAQFSAVGNSHIIPVSSGQNSIAIFLSGFGTGQINFAASVDGTNYTAHDFLNSQTHQIVNAAAADGLFFGGVAGFKQIRLSATSWSSGIVSATTEVATGTQGIHIESSLPEGTNNIGRVSAIVDTGSISAKSGDANQLHVSAVQGDAGLFHVSAVGTITVSAHEVKQSDASALRVSAIVDSGSISAKSSAASTMLVSASQGDAGQLRISAVQGDANNQHVSAVQGDAGLMHVSSIVGDANNQHVSAVQGDAGLLRVSADMFADTVGSLTVFQTLSVSASQSVKGSAGALYGYYLYNSDTKPNYVKFYNVSAAANIGTDTPLMVVMLPASAAANVEFAHGIKGFTNGINVTATSGRPMDNTAAPAASSVGAVLLYV